MEETRNWLLQIAYDGTDYHGWQRQPGVATVQGRVEDALARLFRRPVAIMGCSRTDAGVHALAQMVSCRAPAFPPIPADNTRAALNNLLPPTIRVVQLQPVDPTFSARGRAVGKAYTYLLARQPLANPFLCRYCWELSHPVDTAAMGAAADALAGTHDFTHFAAASRGDDDRDPVKTITSVRVADSHGLLRVTVVGNSFLYKMVRRMVGWLVAVGRGRETAGATLQVLDPALPPPSFDTAPPQGLCLEQVFFDDRTMAQYQPLELPLLGLIDQNTPQPAT